MKSFSEMEAFRPGAARKPKGGLLPFARQVCTGCIELFSLFSFGAKYQFNCRYFKCDRPLLPSSIVKLERCITPFPLNELPDKLLNLIVVFLGGRDLFNFGLVCTKLFRKVKVEGYCDEIQPPATHRTNPDHPSIRGEEERRHEEEGGVLRQGKEQGVPASAR